MKISSSLLIIVALLLLGCAAPVTPLAASGGSRAAGIVEFSYEYGIVDPAPSTNVGLEDALGRCKAWGYKGVLPFNKKLSRCNHFNTFLGMCDNWFVTYNYQCTIVADSAK